MQKKASVQNTLRENNVAFFEDKFPELAMRIREMASPVSSVAFNENGEPLDINLGGDGSLYKGGKTARLFSQQQADDFFKHPRVIMLNRPVAGLGEAEVGDHYNLSLEKLMQEAGVTEIDMLPAVSSGYMMVFGLGLGFHIETIIEQTRHKNDVVIICEPFIEFLSHSLNYIDWKALGKTLDEDGRRLEIITESNPKVIRRKIENIIGDEGSPSLDGTYIYIHYFSWIFDDVISHFSESAYSYFIVRGYYEDEVKMISHATRNFLKRDFHLIEGEVRQRRSEPLFVVGSGASLDKTIETIRKWKDHAIIFSGGTALRALLSNGIRPDYHCELENGEPTYAVLDSVNREFGLQGIKLIASCTLFPEATALFDERYFFFRDSVSSTMIFASDGGYRFIKGTAPTCTNTAVAVATMLGFHQIYLFGVDCGVRDPERHHSTSSVYYTHERFSQIQMRFPIEIPGNFGGKIYTNWVYDTTRQFIGEMGAVYGLSMTNCSDGGLIQHAVPKAARSVEFPRKIDKDAVFEDIRDGSSKFESGRFFKAEKRKYRDYLNAYDGFSNEFEEWLDTLSEKCKDVNALFYETRRFTADVQKRHLSVSELVAASIHNMPRTAQFYISRIMDDKKREEVFRQSVDEYARLAREIVKKGRAVYAELTEEVEAEPI